MEEVCAKVYAKTVKQAERACRLKLQVLCQRQRQWNLQQLYTRDTALLSSLQKHRAYLLGYVGSKCIFA